MTSAVAVRDPVHSAVDEIDDAMGGEWQAGLRTADRKRLGLSTHNCSRPLATSSFHLAHNDTPGNCDDWKVDGMSKMKYLKPDTDESVVTLFD